jgi:hypothetical protein
VKGFDPLSCRSARLCARGSLELHHHHVVPPALDDVVTVILRCTVVDDAFTDRGCLVQLGMLRMNRGLSLLSGGLHKLL